MKEQKNTKALPEKIEGRLAALVKMKEFNMQEVALCRRTYWERKGEWHAILVSCYDRAVLRTGAV